jgi:transposase
MDYNTTIGMDLGNRKHTVCALDADGNVLFRKEVANTPDELKVFFEENKGATVAMETGLCCRWISALSKASGCDTIVGNARELAMIWGDKNKNDRNDAEKIARLARADRNLFHPVTLRDDAHHRLFQLLELREGEVKERTRRVNSIRGMCKANAVFLPSCDAALFHKVAASALPEGMRKMFRPTLDALAATDRAIRRYDAMIEDCCRRQFKAETGLLQTVPGVGPITAAAFVAAVDDPARFGKARDAGPFFGLTPGQDQSGDGDAPKQITRAGNEMVRHLLVNGANKILQRNSKDNALKRHGMKICARGGKVARRKAKVAVARKMAVLMLAMLKSGKEYDDAPAPGCGMPAGEPAA